VAPPGIRRIRFLEEEEVVEEEAVVVEDP